MSNSKPPSKASLIVPVALGLLLLAWEFALQVPQSSIEMAALIFLWSSLPFAVAMLIGLFPKRRAFAIGFVSGTLLTTLFGHYLYFIAPDESGRIWGLVFIPLFNLFPVGPAGGLIAWLLTRYRTP